MSPLRWLLIVLSAVLIPAACYLAGKPSCVDLRGPEDCPAVSR